MGFRVGLNVADSGAIDVGYASVVGADRIAHGEPIYDNFPDDVSQGDTYGPVNYYAYVPFERIWPWSGSWDDLPAAHGAAVVFDLATFALPDPARHPHPPRTGGPPPRRDPRLRLGRLPLHRLRPGVELQRHPGRDAPRRDPPASWPDPLARGALAALATCAKFAPALLAPDAARPTRARPATRPRRRTLRRRRFAAGSAGRRLMLWPAIDPGLHTFYDRTIAYQAGRDSPFSIWGQVPSLEPLRIAILVATAALSLLLAFRPRRKSLVQVAALGAALLIALQLTAAPLVLPLHRLVLPAAAGGARLRRATAQPRRSRNHHLLDRVSQPPSG